MSFPPPPTDKIDWTQLQTAVKDEVNGHVEVTYKNSQWQNPRFVKDPYLRIHGLSPCLNYGQEVYERMKAYRSPSNQILLFRVPMHGQRMAKSAEFVSIPPLPLPLFRQSLHLAVSKNAEFVPPPESGAALYIRPVMIGFSPSLLPSPPTEYLFYIFVQPLAPLHGTHASEAILLEEYDRSAPKGTGAVKVGGNYAPLMRWTGKAAREGYSLILHIDSQTRTKIDEFSTAGFIGVRKNREGMGDGVTVVISSSENIIQSVTTDSVAVIAASMGWKVERRAILYAELPSFQEIIAAGTAAALVPVRSITRKSLGHKFEYGDGGDACMQLREKLMGIMRGEVQETWGWTEVVGDVEVDEGIVEQARI